MKSASSSLQEPPLSHLQTRSKRLRALLLGAACMTLLTFSQANAAPLASGTFTNDLSVYSLNFTVSQATNYTFQTTSYATGGFVPILSLFGPGGAFITDDGGDATCSAGMSADPTTHLCNDASISALLTAGAYSLYLTEFDNFPNGNLSAGFSEQGNGPNFTDSFCAGATTPFQEIDLAPCVQRTANFAVNVTTTPATVTPEPSSLALAALPLLALAQFGLRRHRSA